MDAAVPRCAKCGQEMHVSRYSCVACDLHLEGQFDLTPLAHLTLEEQAFVSAFVRVHGSLKKMEDLFGISYPTVKNRLNALGRKLDASLQAPLPPQDVLEKLGRGEITVDQALELLP